ncbi:MAG: extracellular solute-binding protein [Actinobacteria bacterium]|nr:extracellular solute-binding protein [Actinomycetota bacterium]
MTSTPFTRRGFLGAAAGAAAVPLLASCGSSTSSSSGSSGGAAASGAIKFWDMPWGAQAYSDASKKVTEAYVPEGKNLKAAWQGIQWNNFYQTFASAIASKTGPAVSTGGGFQAYQFAEQGAIAMADDVVATMKTNGMFDDLLPGVLEGFKTKDGYVALPWQTDMRVYWYRKSLLEKAGVAVPTDWPSLLEAGKALKKIGVIGFCTGSGAGNFLGNHWAVSMLINNGGGVWTPEGDIDVVNDRNQEAVEFMLEMVSAGAIDPGAVGFTTDNMDAQWKNSKTGYGMFGAYLPQRVGDTSGDIVAAPPLTGPNGDKTALQFVNNIMMYKNTPDQASSEAFVIYYLQQLKGYWQQALVGGLPVFKSITELPEFTKDPNAVQIVKDYSPIAKTFAARGTASTANTAVLDGGQALNKFAQSILTGKTDAKTILNDFATGLKAAVK